MVTISGRADKDDDTALVEQPGAVSSSLSARWKSIHVEYTALSDDEWDAACLARLDNARP